MSDQDIFLQDALQELKKACGASAHAAILLGAADIYDKDEELYDMRCDIDCSVEQLNYVIDRLLKRMRSQQ